MKKEVILYPDGTAPWPRAVKAGNWIFIAAAGTDPNGNVVGPSFEEQLTYIFETVKKTVESLGSSMENIVHMITFMVNIDDFSKVREIRGKYIPPEKMPATTAVEVTSLVRSFMSEGKLVKLDPPMLVEIDCTAIIPDG